MAEGITPTEVGAVTVSVGTLVTIGRQVWASARKVGELEASAAALEERVAKIEVARESMVSRNEVAAIHAKIDGIHADLRDLGRRIDALLLRRDP